MSISPFPFASTTFTIESLDFATTVFALSVAAEKVFPTFLAVSLRFSSKRIDEKLSARDD